MPEIIWKGTPNYTAGRSGKKIIAIVDHITAGQFPGCMNWLQNPEAKASAHYLVTRAGEIYQLVAEENTAWHAGAVSKPSWNLYDKTNPNRYTIGIEHEGYDSCGGDGTLTEAQYQATLWLHRQLISKWGISVDTDHIIGHYRIDSVNRPNCPGPNFPWTRLFEDLKGVSQVAEQWKQDIIAEAKQEGLITSDHDPDEKATKWFVLAIALGVLKKLRGK